MAKGNKDTGLYEVNQKETDVRVLLRFIQAGEAVLKYADAVLNRAGLSLVKLTVLQILDAEGGTLTPSAIARLTLREKHNITTLIRRLKRDGLITIEPSKTDRRSIQVTITDKGRKAITATLPEARNIVKQVMSQVSESSALALEKTLKTLRQNAFEGIQLMRVEARK